VGEIGLPGDAVMVFQALAEGVTDGSRPRSFLRSNLQKDFRKFLAHSPKQGLWYNLGSFTKNRGQGK